MVIYKSRNRLWTETERCEQARRHFVLRRIFSVISHGLVALCASSSGSLSYLLFFFPGNQTECSLNIRVYICTVYVYILPVSTFFFSPPTYSLVFYIPSLFLSVSPFLNWSFLFLCFWGLCSVFLTVFLFFSLEFGILFREADFNQFNNKPIFLFLFMPVFLLCFEFNNMFLILNPDKI